MWDRDRERESVSRSSIILLICRCAFQFLTQWMLNLLVYDKIFAFPLCHQFLFRDTWELSVVSEFIVYKIWFVGRLENENKTFGLCTLSSESSFVCRVHSSSKIVKEHREWVSEWMLKQWPEPSVLSDNFHCYRKWIVYCPPLSLLIHT